MAALVNELAARSGSDEVVLVLDDYHLIDSRAVHESVTFLLEHLPPRVHLVLSSRADPPLAARAAARPPDSWSELRAADLRFTIDEAAALLRDAVGPDLPLPDTIRGLSRTAPRGGRPGCSSPPCRFAGDLTWPPSSRRSRAATDTSWTT